MPRKSPFSEGDFGQEEFDDQVSQEGENEVEVSQDNAPSEDTSFVEPAQEAVEEEDAPAPEAEPEPYIKPEPIPVPPPEGWKEYVWVGDTDSFVVPDYNSQWGGEDLVFFQNVPRYAPPVAIARFKWSKLENSLQEVQPLPGN